jgi:hypothetical protein
MKKTSKNLVDILGSDLSSKERARIKGGDEQLYPACFNCYCKSGANPPYSGKWFDCYETIQEMLDDFDKYCINGLGHCDAADDPQ